MSKVWFVKSTTKTFFSFKNAIWVSKNAEFGADFESVEKVAKISCEKSYQSNKKVTAKWSFYFYY